jgi:hypothetical protein
MVVEPNAVYATRSLAVRWLVVQRPSDLPVMAKQSTTRPNRPIFFADGYTSQRSGGYLEGADRPLCLSQTARAVPRGNHRQFSIR